MEAAGYGTSGGGLYEPGAWRDQGWQSDDRPVVCVNWEDAQAYVQWLREETGHPYRLPTESEWEYAIRAGTKTRFYWDYRAPDLCTYANSGDCDDGWERTAPVGSFRGNGFWLHDMAGNVSEWAEDCWHENYDGAPRDGSAWTRGGDCWSPCGAATGGPPCRGITALRTAMSTTSGSGSSDSVSAWREPPVRRETAPLL